MMKVKENVSSSELEPRHANEIVWQGGKGACACLIGCAVYDKQLSCHREAAWLCWNFKM